MLFCIVNKKKDIKFFDRDQRNNMIKNPSEGVVVDSGVIDPKYYEFYLQPQSVNMGTASPTHFFVINDDIKMPIEHFENITYGLCYYYWNWKGVVRLPAVLKFAETYLKFSTSVNCDDLQDSLKRLPYYI